MSNITVTRSLLEYGGAAPDEISDRIGRHAARIVRDGDTIQVGAGAVQVRLEYQADMRGELRLQPPEQVDFQIYAGRIFHVDAHEAAGLADGVQPLASVVISGTNSGVIVHCSNPKRWIPNSIEVQIADDTHPKWAKAHPTVADAFTGKPGGRNDRRVPAAPALSRRRPLPVTPIRPVVRNAAVSDSLRRSVG